MSYLETVVLGIAGTKKHIGGSTRGKRILVPTGSTVTVEYTICPPSMFAADGPDTATWISAGDKVGPSMTDVTGPISAIRLTAVTANPTVFIAE